MIHNSHIPLILSDLDRLQRGCSTGLLREPDVQDFARAILETELYCHRALDSSFVFVSAVLAGRATRGTGYTGPHSVVDYRQGECHARRIPPDHSWYDSCPPAYPEGVHLTISIRDPVPLTWMNGLAAQIQNVIGLRRPADMSIEMRGTDGRVHLYVSVPSRFQRSMRNYSAVHRDDWSSPESQSRC
jgi:hypothetical protein